MDEAPLLTAEEERELGSKIQYSKKLGELLREKKITLAEKEQAEEEAQRARDVMIRSNLRLVVNIAKNYLNRG
ncbi:MAG TPA: sigma-70 factor domain-containing protein, partial [Phycisphaerae bacterium]|nr:sigma-70 factor domain-containing protein [Phycisphaerae bacterium]